MHFHERPAKTDYFRSEVYICISANVALTNCKPAFHRTFFVTSVRGRVFAPQIAANASLSFFGAKIPFPAFFIASAFFVLAAFFAVLPNRRFSAVIFFSAASTLNSSTTNNTRSYLLCPV